MLRSRLIVASLEEETIKATTEKGSPQGRVLAPLLWSLVFDDQLRKLNESGFAAQEYAGYLVVIVRGRHDKKFEISCKLHEI